MKKSVTRKLRKEASSKRKNNYLRLHTISDYIHTAQSSEKHFIMRKRKILKFLIKFVCICAWTETTSILHLRGEGWKKYWKSKYMKHWDRNLRVLNIWANHTKPCYFNTDMLDNISTSVGFHSPLTFRQMGIPDVIMVQHIHFYSPFLYCKWL